MWCFFMGSNAHAAGGDVTLLMYQEKLSLYLLDLSTCRYFRSVCQSFWGWMLWRGCVQQQSVLRRVPVYLGDSSRPHSSLCVRSRLLQVWLHTLFSCTWLTQRGMCIMHALMYLFFWLLPRKWDKHVKSGPSDDKFPHRWDVSENFLSQIKFRRYFLLLYILIFHPLYAINQNIANIKVLLISRSTFLLKFHNTPL